MYGPMGVANGQDSTEFNTMLDPNVGDINDNQVGIDVNAVVSLASADGFSEGIDLKGGRQMIAWIKYRNEEEMIKADD